jgi:hypothetical protein
MGLETRISRDLGPLNEIGDSSIHMKYKGNLVKCHHALKIHRDDSYKKFEFFWRAG